MWMFEHKLCLKLISKDDADSEELGDFIVELMNHEFRNWGFEFSLISIKGVKE